MFKKLRSWTFKEESSPHFRVEAKLDVRPGGPRQKVCLHQYYIITCVCVCVNIMITIYVYIICIYIYIYGNAIKICGGRAGPRGPGGSMKYQFVYLNVATVCLNELDSVYLNGRAGHGKPSRRYSLKYKFVYLKIRIFKCSYRICDSTPVQKK